MTLAIAGCGGQSQSSHPSASGPVEGWQLVWSPDPATDGLDAFEGIEDNVGGGGGQHIFAEDDQYRWIMDTLQRNPPGNRQRNEVKGMKAGGSVMTMGLGERWRITYSMLIPHTMVSTGAFFHINQFKRPGIGTEPLATTSIIGQNVALRAFTSSVTVASVPLSSVYDSWIEVEIEMTIGTSGRLRWVVRKGGRTLADGEKTGVNLWLGDRLRPKWGIYRGVTPGLQSTSLLIKDLKAFKQVGGRQG